MSDDFTVSLGTLLTVLAWTAAAALIGAGCWLEAWRLVPAGMFLAVVAATLTVVRDGHETRRVVRAVWRGQEIRQVRGR